MPIDHKLILLLQSVTEGEANCRGADFRKQVKKSASTDRAETWSCRNTRSAAANDAEAQSRSDVPTLPATTLLCVCWAIAMPGSWAGTGPKKFLPRQGGPEPSFASTRIRSWLQC